MKNRRIILLIVFTLVIALFSTGPALAKGGLSKITGIRFGPTQLIPPPGQIWEDPPGERRFVRGNLFHAEMELKLDGEVVSAWFFYTMNANFELPDEAAGETSNKGPMWGTFWITYVDDLSADPIFEGVWTSNGGFYNMRYKNLTGFGIGEYYGFKMKAFMRVVDRSIGPAQNDWKIRGYIHKLP